MTGALIDLVICYLKVHLISYEFSTSAIQLNKFCAFTIAEYRAKVLSTPPPHTHTLLHQWASAAVSSKTVVLFIYLSMGFLC